MCYENYLNNRYVVNRCYQRKLVWTLEEKQAFIDSISKKYSVPLFLFATKEKDGSIMFEIIDGMQRLNAIMAFIENEYPVEINGIKGYFDLTTLSTTNYLLDQKKLQQKEPVLNRQDCVDITNYQLPNTYINADTKSVEEIFRRINSFGKQLSKQEIRQAGATGAFPELVRLVSSHIRGDVSPSNSVILNRMKEISLSNKKLDYGITMENVYWVKQKIVTIPNMRVSRDEELIAWILAYMILGKEANPTANDLDRIYGRDISISGIELANSIDAKINALTPESIKKWYISIHALVLNILEFAKCDFRTLIYQKKYSEGLIRTYQVIFLALFELIVNDKLKVNNLPDLVDDLKEIGNTILKGIGDKTWNASTRHQRISAVKGIIKKNFMKAVGSDVLTENWTLELDGLIRMSRIEGDRYDFKTGFHNLVTGNINNDLFFKIVEILTAEVNKAPNTKGYVIIGITEGENTYNMYKNHYGDNNAVKIEGTDFFVTGVQDEIKQYYSGSGDKLQNEILNNISKAPVDKSIIQQIKQNIKMVKYGDKDVVILMLESTDKPIAYDGKIYIREGNNTKVLTDIKTTIEYCKRVFNATDLI